MDSIIQNQLFNDLFCEKQLLNVFEQHYSTTTTRGYDGLTGEHISRNAPAVFHSVAEKCVNKSFRFTPYKEKLLLKGRDSEPRMTSIPSVRDRVVFKQINHFLREAFPEVISQSMPKKVVKEVLGFIESQPLEGLWVYSGDVKKFYDSLSHEYLFHSLQQRVYSEHILSLIAHACITPTLPVNTARQNHKNYKSKKGVPQGIAIAGTLASIYMLELDQAMKNLNVHYSRFVDDILIIGAKDEVLAAKDLLKQLISEAKLELHDNEKEVLQKITEPFQYLGYYFELPDKISVRESSINKLRNRIIKICGKGRQTKSNDFLWDLNCVITGFVDVEKKRHIGWLSYYNEINDLTLLYELDNFVQQQLQRTQRFKNKPAPEVKSFVRAYYESKHSLYGGYICQMIGDDLEMSIEEATER